MLNDAARKNPEHPSWNNFHDPSKHVHPQPGAAGQLGGATGDVDAAGSLGGQLGGHLSQAVRTQAGEVTFNEDFEREFWSGTSLNDLYASASTKRQERPARWSAFLPAACANTTKLRERRITDPGTLLDGTRRAMRASFQREMDVVESSLSFLASVGSVSPYVGLFGTVWGIMHAFTGFAAMEQVTLATVAPGIAEALVATAMGLFAAIPAVMAYNRFAQRH